MIALWMAACMPDPSDLFLVVDGREGVYEVVATEIPELADPATMRGALGDGSVGGFVDIEGLGYYGGGAIDVRYSVQDGVAVPHTDDGLVLWSYYHTLSTFRDELAARDIDVEPIFPVPFAYQPTVYGAVFTAMNAAYVSSGVHMFVLLADSTRSDLPLAANPGVIRHEFGHAMFQLIVAGSVGAAPPTDSRALNEGFADALATLSLDDPHFLEASLPIDAWISVSGERRVDEDANTRTADPVGENPYSRGTVYASLAWDFRELTNPDIALDVVVASLEEWAAVGDWAGTEEAMDKWARIFTTNAVEARPAATEGLCAKFVERFPDALLPAGCQ